MKERGTLRPGGMEFTHLMLDLANFPSGARLLDVCCGAGTTVEMLLNSGFNAWGIDLDAMTEDLPLVRGSAYDLPCMDASLDGILCECGFSSLEPDTALEEFARVLKSGGTLLISDLYSRAEGGHVGVLRVHTRERFERLLAKHGFELQIFADHTDALKSFLARQIMERGCDWLRGELRLDPSKMQPLKCGYCVFMARKL